ncbi:MAG: hypothetical protein AAB482_04650 [Patescibacteria group bacterium]
MTERAKQLTLLGSLFVTAVFFWLLVSALLPSLQWESSVLLWSTVVVGTILAVLWALSVILVENAMMLILVSAVSSFIGVLWFLDPIFIAAASILFVGSIIGYYRTYFAVQNTLDGNLARPLRKAVPLFVTCLIAVFSTAYYIKNASVEIQVESVIPEAYFIKAAEFAGPTIKNLDPTFFSAMTISESIIAQVKKEYPTLTKEQAALAVDESIQKYSEKLKIQVKPTDTYLHVLYLTGMSIVHAQVDPYKHAFPKVYAIALFFTLRILSFPVYWLAIWLAIIILRTLHRFGIVELRAVPATILAYSFSPPKTKQ